MKLGNKCQCTGCGLIFRSVGAFDKHRRNGRCLTVREMQIAGMAVRKDGVWLSALNRLFAPVATQ